MNLYDKISDDLKDAMKKREVETVSVLRLLVSSLKNKAIDLKKELEDAEVISVVRGDVKKIEDSIGDFVKGEREDLADKARSEVKIMRKYLPPEISDEDLEKAVKKVIDELEVGDMSGMGKAMGKLMEELKDQVDGNRVKDMLCKYLQK